MSKETREFRKKEKQLQERLEAYHKRPDYVNTDGDIRKQSVAEWFQERLELIRQADEAGKRIREDTDSSEMEPFLLSSQYVPIKQIKEGIVESNHGVCYKIMQFSPVNYHMMDEFDRESVIRNFAAYLRIAPEVLHIKSIARRMDISEYLQKIQKINEQETVESRRKLRQDYAKIFSDVGSREGVSRSFYMIFQNTQTKGSSNFNDIKGELNGYARDAATYLKNCGNEQIPCDSVHDIAEVLYRFYNRNTSRKKAFSKHLDDVSEEYMRRFGHSDNIPVRDYIAPDRIDLRSSKYLVMDGTYYTYIMIAGNGYKQEEFDGWFSRLINLGEGIDVDLFIRRLNPERLRRVLNMRLNVDETLVKTSKNSKSENHEVRRASVKAGYYIKECLANEQDPYYVNTLITISSPTYDGMIYKLGEVKKILRSSQNKINPCWFKQEQCFRSSMFTYPLHPQLYKLTRRNVMSEGLSSFYPFISFELADSDGVLLGMNQKNHSLVIQDLFNTKKYPNANIAIIGKSGAGKTYTSLVELSRIAMNNIPVTIITPIKGQEILALCKELAGAHIKVHGGSENCINIMDIRKADDSDALLLDDDYEACLLSQKSGLLKDFFHTLLPDITYEELQDVDTAIMNCYEEFGITLDNNSIVDERGNKKPMPVLSDLQRHLNAIEGVSKRLPKALNIFVSGSAKNFNRQTNVDLSNPFTVMDCSHASPDIRDAVYLIVTDVVYSIAKEDRSKKKVIAFDETWKLIGAGATDRTAKLVVEIFKIIRGFGGSAWCITQDVNDFMAYKDGIYGKGILNACTTKIVLALEKREAEATMDVFDLTQSDMRKITGLQRGEAMLISNRVKLMVDIKSSQYLHELISTDRADLENRVKKLKEQT